MNSQILDLTPTVVSAASPAVPAVPQPVAPVQAAAPPAPPWAGGYVGVTSTPGWPDARPVGGIDSNLSQSSHQYFGSSSRSPNHTSLSSSPVYVMGLPVNMLFQSQPNPAVQAPTAGMPAYCFHCLQYCSVFIMYPALRQKFAITI